MARRTLGLKLGHIKEETNCREKEDMQYLCTTNEKTGQCCGKHRRRLELFCEDDEAFICVLCVPRHSTHTFVFLNEALCKYKGKLKTALSSLESKVEHLKNLQNKQEKKIVDIHEDAFSLEQYIKQEFAKLQRFLQDKEQKLIQQLKSEIANILKENKGNPECVKRDISANISVSDDNLESKNKEAAILTEMEVTLDCIKNGVVATQATLFDNKLDVKQQKPLNLLTVPETFEDIAVTFSEEEWKMLRQQDKELHREVMVQNYETLVSVGYKIPQKELLLLFKAYDKLPVCDVKEKRTTEKKKRLEGNLHSARSTEYSEQSSLGTPQLHHQTETLQQCAQPGKAYDKVHLSPAPQLESGYNCTKSSECDNRTPQLHHSTKNCAQLMNGYDKFCVMPVRPLQSGHKYDKSFGSGTIFTAQQRPLMHPRSHKGKKAHTCTECSKCFPSLTALQRHCSIHTGEKPYKCTECSKCFTQKGHLKCHQVSHTGNKPYKCAECSKSFIWLSTLKQHQAIHSGEKPYKCAECDKCFKQKTHLKVHQNSHSGSKPYKCAECDKSFVWLSSIQRHQASHSGEKPYKCSECGKCFKGKAYLKVHQNSHAGKKKPYKCAECGKCFLRLGSFQRHHDVHTEAVGVKTYKCTKCSKRFEQKETLQQHKKTHMQEKPYKCSECGKCFAQKAYLKGHQYSHTFGEGKKGNAPFKCVDCSKCFSSLFGLQQHHTIHTGEKPYKCTECYKCFSQKNNLVRHQMTHRKVSSTT